MGLRRMGWMACWFLLVVGFPCGVAFGVEIGQVDDFEDMSTEGWGSAIRGGVSNPNPPDNIVDPMDAANRILRIRSSGGGGAGSKLAAIALDGQWDGDYVAAEVVAIQLDAINLGSSPLFLRIVLREAGNTAVSKQPLQLPAPTPAEDEWVRHEFSLDPAALDCSGTCGLTNVTEVRIISSANGGSFRGDPILGSVGVDLITALPEPVAAMQGAAALGVIALLSRSRWRRPTG